jgi:hypothetical protein
MPNEIAALDAICDRITALAADATVEDLAKLADAYGKAAYGPQGGVYEGDTSSVTRTYTRSKTTSTSRSRAVTTQHFDRPGKKPAGFVKGDDRG